MKVKVLGDYNYRTSPSGTTAFQLSDSVLIDAGSVFRFLETPPELIEHVFLTHSHYDHILELPFLIDSTFDFREKTLKVYGNRFTIDSLKKYIFNNSIWPDFSQIALPKSSFPALEFVVIEEGTTVEIDGFEIVPFSVCHSIPTFGYFVKSDSVSVVFSGDTYVSQSLIQILDSQSIGALFVDVSFPSSKEMRAKISGHLTPKRLREVLSSIGDGFQVFVFHVKPFYKEVLEEEFEELIPFAKILRGGETVIVGS